MEIKSKNEESLLQGLTEWSTFTFMFQFTSSQETDSRNIIIIKLRWKIPDFSMLSYLLLEFSPLGLTIKSYTEAWLASSDVMPYAGPASLGYTCVQWPGNNCSEIATFSSTIGVCRFHLRELLTHGRLQRRKLLLTQTLQAEGLYLQLLAKAQLLFTPRTQPAPAIWWNKYRNL